MAEPHPLSDAAKLKGFAKLPGRAIQVDYPLRLGKGDARREFVIAAAE